MSIQNYKMSSSVIDKVNKIIRGNKVAVFAKTYCPHCNATRSALNGAGVKFHNEDLDLWDSADMNAAQDHFAQTTGARSVPRVFIDGKCIGGNSDFQSQYVQTGKINQLK
jgi:glutaredoxin 3